MDINQFEGGGLTFWDGKTTTAAGKIQPDEIHYDTRSGDVAFIDRYVGRSLCYVAHLEPLN